MSGEWEALDELIVEGRILSAVYWIRAAFECSLQEAVQFLYARYDRLRQTRPDDFAKSHEDYWRDVYT
ncbi:hypothetical protein [Actinomadura rubrisoli]|uniref:Uncharacterized protein n=1 Tax=Actinomadura rubrisoli TaxID=2530368 RepID=A0A4R5B6H8_9ACTN|nr:hypothetical protein [Actinomadura rubrisoli]TDD80469.1 hypothetical protein E1298_25725 [Actinomadura rubrisoli]